MAEKFNNLDGKTWLKYSFSIIRDLSKTKEEKSFKHPAMFPSQLTSRFIEIYSKNDGEVVLDPFMGSGSTLISAYEMSKKGIGFEINEEYIKLTNKRFEQGKLDTNKVKFKPEIYQKTIFDIPNVLEKESVDLVITSPPYWDILTATRSADRKEIRKYSDSEIDLGNIKDYPEFLNKLKEAFDGVCKVLKRGKYCIVVVMDIRKKSKFYPFHIDMTKIMEEVGFELDDIMIWDRQKEYNNMRPLGYPYMFRVNKVHEFILIFKKK